MRFLKHILLVLLLCLIGEASALAGPVYNKPRHITQPDGIGLTLVGRGDEFCHFTTTTDGYTVVKASDGFYYYADLRDGVLVPGAVKAYDAENRVSSEVSYLSTKEKFLAPAMTKMEKTLKASARKRNDLRASRRMRKVASTENKGYKGLLILVNFTDKKFSRGDESASHFYNMMMNLENFKSYYDEWHGYQEYTGSVRDYFSDNSNGQFVPEFDVIGPIELDVSQYYVNCVENSFSLVEKVLRKADEQVDYKDYDSDGDGEVDMIYILYAGYSSHYNGNDPRLIWPHAASMSKDADPDEIVTLDGVQMGRFACSAEIFGWEEDKKSILDGIGVIVHEFAHVLGFEDHYDTSNGYQEHPNNWDVMAAGNNSEDFNRTPVAFNSYEKYVTGFSMPLNITDMGGQSVRLGSNEKTSDACMIRSTQDNVFYIMENRQHDKWDKYLPGHGLLVWRVDSTNVEYWKQNVINVTTRACFRLVRACGTQGSFLTGVEDTDFDPFPGTHNITELDNDDDDANLISYDGFPCPVVLRNIKEEDGIITFDVVKDDYIQDAPITYELPSKFKASAERKVGDSWESTSWTVTTRKHGDELIISNLVPNTTGITNTAKDYSKGVYVTYTYSNETAHTININAQRVALNDEYGTWLCDINNVNNSGTGSMTLTVDRYGIPTFKDPSTVLSYITLKPKAYVVSTKNLIDQLDAYRNVTFSYIPGTYAIDTVTDDESNENITPDNCTKLFDGNRIIIVRDGKRFTTAGNQIK